VSHLNADPVHSSLLGESTAPTRVAFVHGLFGRGKNFTRIATGLQPDAQSLLIDLPNHGSSAWTEELSFEQLADLVAAHLRAGFASTGPVDIVGHSMGGKVAMVLALRHPRLVRRLVIVDISPVVAGEVRGEFPHLLSALLGLDLASLSSRTDAHEALREQIPSDTVRGFLLQNLKRVDGGFAWEPNLRLLFDELGTISGFPEVLADPFEGPVLWVRGERSDYIDPAELPLMREFFPNAELVTISGAGHWVHSEKPAEFTGALREFLLED